MQGLLCMFIALCFSLGMWAYALHPKANIMFLSMLNFFWGHPLGNFVRCAILNIVGTINGFSPKLWSKTSRMDHTICHLLQGMIFLFSNTILLWTLGHSMLQLNTFNGTIVFKSVVDVFTAFICCKHLIDFPYWFFKLRL
jgi:hypothetical protein